MNWWLNDPPTQQGGGWWENDPPAQSVAQPGGRPRPAAANAPSVMAPGEFMSQSQQLGSDLMSGVGTGMRHAATSIGSGAYKAADSVGLMPNSPYVRGAMQNFQQGADDALTEAEGSVGGSIGSLVGQAGAFAVAPQAGLTRYLAPMVAGGLYGAGQNDASASDVGMSAALGAAGPLAHDVGKPIAGHVINTLRGKKSDSAQEMINLGQQHNVPVHAADAAPGALGSTLHKIENVSQYAPVGGTTGPRMAQNKAQQQAAQNFAGQYPLSPTYAQDIQGSAIDRAQQLRQQGGDKFNAAAAAEGSEIVDPNLMRGQAKQMLDAELSRPEQYQRQNILNIGEKFSADPQTDVAGLHALRSEISDQRQGLVSPLNPSPDSSEAGRMLKGIQGRLETDIDAYTTTPAYQEAKSFWANQVIPVTKNKAAHELRGSQTPDKSVKNIFLGTADIDNTKSQVFNALTPEGQQEVRALMVQTSLEKAMPQTVDGPFSAAKFVNELDRHSKLAGIAFDDVQRKEMDGLIRLFRATDRGGQVAGNPQTGMSNLISSGYGAGTVGGLTLGAPGAAAAAGLGMFMQGPALRWLLTSRPGKAMLLATSELPESSPAIHHISRAVQAMISASAVHETAE